MNNRRFQRREPIQKQSTCRCGSPARLIKRRNFPFGRGSGGRTTIIYRCDVCREERPVKA